MIKRTHSYQNGAKMFTMHCHDCGEQFKHPLGDVPQSNWRRHEFDDSTFRRIILGDDSLSRLAAELGCSQQLLQQIRTGKLHLHRMPDLQRSGANAPPPVIPDGPNCWHCSEWRVNRCEMGFPDPLVEGLGFAADCSLYDRR
jgi:hypothetical protein